jgi:pyridoxamine 5'-phosphate oxidase
MPEFSPSLQDLTEPQAILDDAIERLKTAVHDRKQPFRTPVLVTADGDARVVVLREAEPTHLAFHTDARSGKVEPLRERPEATFVFYDASLKLQLRVATQASVHVDDKLADDHWAAAQEMAKRCYYARPAPDTPIAGPDEHDQAGAEGRENFAVVRCELVTLDWLFLRAEGHRRLRVRFGTEPNFQWLAP